MPGKYFFLFYIFIFCNLNLVNKFKFWGIIAGVATFATVVGYWAKITHQVFADTLLAIGMWSLSVSAGVYVYFKFVKLQGKK